MSGKRNGRFTKFSSPFSSDTDPSFIVYENNNSFYDFANGIGGDIIDLVRNLEGVNFNEAVEYLFNGDLLPIATITQEPKKRDTSKFKNFDYSKFIAKDKVDIKAITKYAKSRRIKSNYIPSCSFSKKKDAWVKHLGLMFVHKDEDLDVCGVKIRHIDDSVGRRFTGRGRLCFHLLENTTDNNERILYLMESETSANSLYETLRASNINFVILCVGGVSNYPERLPNRYSMVKDIRVIIDYDGGAKDKDGVVKYEKHMENYKQFGNPVDIKLGKGDDINKMYCEGKENEILKLVL